MLNGITLCSSGCSYYGIGQVYAYLLLLLLNVMQMTELKEENSLLRKQVDSGQNVTNDDTEPAGKVDKNANLQVMHTSDELTASDTKQQQNIETAEQQVSILC